MTWYGWFFLGGLTFSIIVVLLLKGSLAKTVINGKLKQKNTAGSTQNLSAWKSRREMRKHQRDAEKISKQMEKLTK